MTEPMILKVRAAASAKAVQHALTDAAELRAWFAEHAEVDLPGRYEFWGRYTPEGDAPHQRLLHADDRTLRFEWTLDGVATTTELTLTDEGPESTLVTLAQSHFDFNEALTGASIRGVLQTFWSLALANLVDHVEGRPITPRTDFTSRDLAATVTIAAPASEIYASILDSAKVSEWFGYPVGIEPHVGGRFQMGGLDAEGPAAIIVDLVPDERISIDWGPVGVGTWELEGSAGQTKLTLVQSGFAGEPPYPAWTGIVAGVASLRRFHELPGAGIWVA
ncbi:hypothetical protein Val02_37340 [Virgisporangium aliadipatigenens]|uniref:Activator of Hsp90 ATPase homologue 1/2-like C-terminal domain-containing protein n=1 Tax=Virgisporangium aliadipatigenens TaxID=741659 RepID=A0A8J3YMJ8_9ACTN|nr:SRPBCC domain-containing protein [Virgisporangium aliadipatigenens]GIJ46848.1 hypothetical protein Val02_37340 [Virgisporangium aliadipatigenens]